MWQSNGGIAAAVRNMPYGIQQPAVSGQIARLEEALGTKLFNRRPFLLLPTGVELFELVKPCYTTMFPSYYDGFADAFLFSDSNFTRQRGPMPRDCRQAGEIDVAITIIDSKRRPEIHSRPLLELPLILLVNKKHHLTTAK